MKTILITGGAGFIGSCLVRQLLAGGQYLVVNLDKLTYAGNLHSLETAATNSNYVFVRGDICDSSLLEQLFSEYQPSAVFNLAAETHVDRSLDGPESFIQTNFVGTFRLLEAARQHWQSRPAGERDRFRFLHVSTDEVYGSLGASGAFDESSPYRPNSPYAASKAASDHLVRSYFHSYGLPTLITNTTNNYGPYQFPEKLIPLMTLNALEGRSLPVYGDGQNSRDWIFVEDHCHALRVVLERGSCGEVYNIVANCERTNLQLVQAICEIVDRLRPDLPHKPTSQLITYVPDRPGHDRRYAIDASKIRRELRWAPTWGFADALEFTVQWYLNNAEWVERVTSGTYQRERLGLQRSTP